MTSDFQGKHFFIPNIGPIHPHKNNSHISCTMASTISKLLNIPQVALGGYALYWSVISITKLQKYEERTKQAAQYSRTAQERLHKTRTTQAAGALAVSPMLTICNFRVPRCLVILLVIRPCSLILHCPQRFLELDRPHLAKVNKDQMF